MSQYNWSNLSDHDFEMVCRDVLSVLLGNKQVEAFARGTDGGIDLRYETSRLFVLGQAKHYQRTPFSGLKTDVKKEKGKIDKLPKKPTRYVLFTTQPLSPSQKSSLKEQLEPYCTKASDILGVEDIEGIIQKNPEIERHHYKLWLSSAKVLESILGNATRTHSEIRIRELTDKGRLFVPHNDLPEAERILRTEKSLIISGPPGIGKTTLAEMLALRFLAADFEVHFVSNVNALEERLREGLKQTFVYDDFLGRTNLSDAPKQTDQERLFAFMRHLRNVPNAYLVMTTREYLYREAAAANERMSENRADVLKCLIDVSGYTRENRARILYNHLYWASGFNSADLKDFVGNRGYKSIIDHKEFNPRFIADTINRISPKPAMQSEGDDEWI